jgi:hypothetical protein
MHGGDHRLRQGPQHHLQSRHQARSQRIALDAFRRLLAAKFAQVGAGRKPAPLTRQHQRAHAIVLIGVLQRVAQRRQQRGVERVQLVRPIHADDAHDAVILDAHYVTARCTALGHVIPFVIRFLAVPLNGT